ncbi:MAG: hypothetical protein ACO3JL_11945, partial [Myxococcota bacterium]
AEVTRLAARLHEVETGYTQACQERDALRQNVESLLAAQGSTTEATQTLRGSLEEMRAREQELTAQRAQLQGDLATVQAKLEQSDMRARTSQQHAESATRKMQEIEQLARRLKHAYESAAARVLDLEQRAELTSEQHGVQVAAAREGMEHEVQRLQAELQQARRSLRDALMKAEQLQQQHRAFKEQRTLSSLEGSDLSAMTFPPQPADESVSLTAPTVIPAPGEAGNSGAESRALAASVGPEPIRLAGGPSEPVLSHDVSADLDAEGFDEATRMVENLIEWSPPVGNSKG